MVPRRGEGDFKDMYRPRRLSEMVGNAEAKKKIAAVFKKKKIPNMFLFYGPVGTGKLTLARILIMGLNCEKGPTSEPCCECYQCEQFIKHNDSPDLTEISNLGSIYDTYPRWEKNISDFNSRKIGASDSCGNSIMLSKRSQSLHDKEVELLVREIRGASKDQFFIFCADDKDEVFDSFPVFKSFFVYKALAKLCPIEIELKPPSKAEIQNLLTDICKQEGLIEDPEVIEDIVKSTRLIPLNVVDKLEQKKREKSLKRKPVRFVKGSTDLLVIAPHGVNVPGVEYDDDYTDLVAETVSERLKCSALINDSIKRNICDYNDIQDIQDKDPEFIDNLKSVVDADGMSFVLWLHGAKDESIEQKTINDNNFKNKPKSLHALIGYGQGPDPTVPEIERSIKAGGAIFTAEPHIAANFRNLLSQSGMNTLCTNKDSSNYRGRSPKKMNQWFRNNGYALNQVQTFQLEIRNDGFRDNKENATKAADIISKAFIESFSKRANRPATESEQSRLDSAVQKGEIQQIQVGEIDLGNDQFMARIDGIKSDAMRFNGLVESIKKNGIINNIIVRRRGDADGKPYQLISGFRRMTALQTAIPEKDFENVAVLARILDESVSDDEAYQFSFTENLERKDLSMWEIARAFAKIKEQKETEGNMSAAQIEEYLASLIQKDARTVRRYLKLATILNPDVIKALHIGFISPTDALEIGKKDFIKDDALSITTLLRHLRTHPKTTREFKWFYDNLGYCCDCSGMYAYEVLGCKNADSFLSLEAKELENRIEYLRKKSGKPYSDILQGKVEPLTKDLSAVEADLNRKARYKKFQEDKEPFVKKVTDAFHRLGIRGKFNIRPVLNSLESEVAVTITVPESQMLEAIGAIAGVKNKPTSKVPAKPYKKTGFRDWTESKNNVNICTGCENDCIYCYAKYLAIRRKQVDPGQWSKMKIRQHDVKKGRKIRKGLVGFPSTHDIFPSNIDAYLTVLEKLLQAGNEVLIVSKPHLDCIKQICEGSQPFKDKILFRFTIGAMNEKILSFWEPNAPKYEERKASLRYAFDNGFRTSVSMEPMLDKKQIERIIADLRPFVTEDIWLGTMNHLNQIKAGADKKLAEEIAIIEAGQTPEKLLAIHDTFKDDPLIKWKTDAFKTFADLLAMPTSKGPANEKKKPKVSDTDESKPMHSGTINL